MSRFCEYLCKSKYIYYNYWRDDIMKSFSVLVAILSNCSNLILINKYFVLHFFVGLKDLLLMFVEEDLWQWLLSVEVE